MKFMVSFLFRSEDLVEIKPFVSQERARSKELTKQGVVQGFYVSSDNSHVWMVMKSESRDQLQTYLESFPIYPYYRQLEVTTLAG